jgi:hypothetical protein
MARLRVDLPARYSNPTPAGSSGRLGSYVDLLLRYADQDRVVRAMCRVIDRIEIGDTADAGNVPDEPMPSRRPPAQTHQLTEAEQQTIFAEYRRGVGPRELSTRYGVTERAIKYLVKKHGVRPEAKAVIGGRA